MLRGAHQQRIGAGSLTLLGGYESGDPWVSAGYWHRLSAGWSAGAEAGAWLGDDLRPWAMGGMRLEW